MNLEIFKSQKIEFQKYPLVEDPLASGEDGAGGVQGPGDITRWVGLIASAAFGVIWSLRTTFTGMDGSISPNRCTRFQVNES